MLGVCAVCEGSVVLGQACELCDDEWEVVAERSDDALGDAYDEVNGDDWAMGAVCAGCGQDDAQ
eukprot:gene6861-285_t